MRIKEVTEQNRRDFNAILFCEHCNHEQHLNGGYDDDNFHFHVIPKISCNECGQAASKSYRPLKTKYESWEVI